MLVNFIILEDYMKEETKKAVAHVAGLAKLKLTEEQLAKYAGQAEKIIDYFHKLNKLDTSKITPTAHAIDVVSPLRNDDVEIFKEINLITNETPEMDGPFIQVPKVI